MTDYQKDDRCWCLNKLQHDLKGNPFCTKHGKSFMYRPKENFKEPKQRVPRRSGASKSPHHHYEY